jgi:hypothetical protein
MIKPLRKRHLQIWLTLSVLLPVGIVVAWLTAPEPVKDRLLQPVSSETFPVILKKLPQREPAVSIRCNADTTRLQLEWASRTVLTYPSALIYQVKDSNSKIESGNIIGRVDVRGVYHFPLRKDAKNFHFIVYDIIHHQIIQHINF